MANFNLKYGSQHVDISAKGQRIVVSEQLIDYSDDKRKQRSKSPVSVAAATFFAKDDRYSLHVGNLPYDTTEHDLRKLFSGYNISGARIPARRRNDRTRGCGFVDMTSLRDAQNAIKSLSGLIFLGREVTVMMSRSNFSTAAVREEHDEEPPEKKLKRGSDWGRDVKKSISQGLKYEERSGFASPQPLEPATPSTEPTLLEALALEFAQLWVDEYAGPDTGRKKKTESLAGLLLELDVPDSKLREQISRTFMARAVSKKEMVEASKDCLATSNSMAVKLEQYHWREIKENVHAGPHLSFGGRDVPTRPSRPQALKESQETRRFGSVAWTDGGRKTMRTLEGHERENEDCVMLAKVAIDVHGNDENQSGHCC